jgi:hypothetical protein
MVLQPVVLLLHQPAPINQLIQRLISINSTYQLINVKQTISSRRLQSVPVLHLCAVLRGVDDCRRTAARRGVHAEQKRVHLPGKHARLLALHLHHLQRVGLAAAHKAAALQVNAVLVHAPASLLARLQSLANIIQHLPGQPDRLPGILAAGRHVRQKVHAGRHVGDRHPRLRGDRGRVGVVACGGRHGLGRAGGQPGYHLCLCCCQRGGGRQGQAAHAGGAPGGLFAGHAGHCRAFFD